MLLYGIIEKYDLLRVVEIGFLLFHFPTSHTTVRTGLVYGGSLRYNLHLIEVVRQENVTS